MSISVVRLTLLRCGSSVASTAQKSIVGRAVRAGLRAVSLFNYVCAGFDCNSQWECKTLSVIHLEGETTVSSLGTTTTVSRGGLGWNVRRRKG